MTGNPYEGIEEIVSEPPGGDNHGWMASNNPEEEGYQLPLNVADMQAREVMQSGGFVVVQTRSGSQRGSVYGARDMGMTSHRGVLHPDEYVDWFTLRASVEADLGFTYAEVNEAYAVGRPSVEQRQLREKIDARLLALSRAGGNMEQLAKALSISEKTIDRALKRAREVDVTPMVPHGVVKRDRVCFKCGEHGASPRRRRHSTSFLRDDNGRVIEDRRGTVDLCDAHYAEGFNLKPGNPAYWAFRAQAANPAGAR